MATADQQAFLRSLEEQNTPGARSAAARQGRFMQAAGGGLNVTITRAAGQNDRVNAGPINFTVTFNKTVTGFTNTDVSFAGSTVGGTLAAAVTGTGPSYNVAVTGMTGNGNVLVSIPAGAATDVAGNLSPGTIAAFVRFNTTAPTVTINQAAGQTDPTAVGPINFTVVFSVPVTGFAASDVSLTGSTATGTLSIAVTGSGATYNVAVSGMTGAGNVVASVPAGGATDLAGNPNLASTSTDNVVVFDNSVAPINPVTHGSQLTVAIVGPWGLQGVAKGSEVLTAQTITSSNNRLGSLDARPAYIPGTAYVNNRLSSNHGGIVPAGGMVIDDFSVPAGVWVVQNYTFNLAAETFLLYGDSNNAGAPFPGVFFRGCRMRGASTAPGYINNVVNSHTKLWMTWGDCGSTAPATPCEVAFSLTDDTTTAVFFRNYLSYLGTGFQPNGLISATIENLLEKITLANPGWHLNGCSYAGGQQGILFLRNRFVVVAIDELSNQINQTDCFAMFQDFSPYPGTGTNIDGSTGYQVKDNFVGGTGYCFYLGTGNKGAVSNLTFTGNRITTSSYVTGGFNGPVTNDPAWGSNGNNKSDNLWADGPNAGVPFV